MFQDDLKEALEVEKKIANAVNFWARSAFNDTAEYDLEINIKVEVKLDKQATETGNVAIEVGSSGKRAGLSATEANYWIYSIADEFYVCETQILKDYLRDKWSSLQRVKGGDNNNAHLVLLPLEEFKNLFKKI